MAFDVKSILRPGMHAVIEKILTESDTAMHHGRDQLGHLIDTQVYIEMFIEATVKVIDDRLPEGFTTVGRSLELTLDAPTCLGMHVQVMAILDQIVGDRLFFDIKAWDDYGPVGSGKFERAVVNKEKLFERANQRLLKV